MAGRKAKASTDAELVFVPLGGAGEIGMNCYLYGYGPEGDRRWLMVDLGITFPGDQEPGVDVIMPDLGYIIGERGNLDGLVLTHGHEDHLGAVIDLWPDLKVPIYATPFTAGLLKAKLGEERPGLKLPIKEVPLRSRLTIGPFDVELVNVAHSIPESNALAIRTPAGLVFHTADWKIDNAPVVGEKTDEARIRALGEEGVDVLICDSTNALRDGISPSESEVGNTIKRLIKEARNCIAVTTFASNVGRVRCAAEAAAESGRDLVIAGRALHRVVQVGQETGYLSPRLKFHDQDAFPNLPRNKVVALLTGSQGEPRAALARVANKEHPAITFGKDDTVIFSSRPIPGNEEDIGRVLNGLADQGVRIITDGDALVHVTGHPRRGELEQMYAWTKPKCLIPMHGEARHMEEQGRLALAKGVPKVVQVRNGRMVRLGPGDVRHIEEVPVGRVYRDGNLLLAGDDTPVRERRKLSFTGIVCVSLVLERDGELAADPEIALDGIPLDSRSGAVEGLVYQAVEGALESIPRGKRKDLDRVREAVTRAARAAVNEAWGKKPICKVLLTTL
jgi:ribonuclease J